MARLPPFPPPASTASQDGCVAKRSEARGGREETKPTHEPSGRGPGALRANELEARLGSLAAGSPPPAPGTSTVIWFTIGQRRPRPTTPGTRPTVPGFKAPLITSNSSKTHPSATSAHNTHAKELAKLRTRVPGSAGNTAQRRMVMHPAAHRTCLLTRANVAPAAHLKARGASRRAQRDAAHTTRRRASGPHRPAPVNNEQAPPQTVLTEVNQRECGL